MAEMVIVLSIYSHFRFRYHGPKWLWSEVTSDRAQYPCHRYVSANSTAPGTSSSTAAEFLTHPSFCGNSEAIAVQRSLRQQDDIPLKVLVINCHSIVDKKPMLVNMIESTHADIVLGTESWLKSHHLSTEIFPTGFKVYRKDREHKNGGGVFILVSDKFISTEPEELKLNGKTELVWAQIQVPGSSQLFDGSFYRPPDESEPDCLDDLQRCLGRIPTGAHTWIGGDFNLGNINWDRNGLKPMPTCLDCKQLLTVAGDNFLEQMVTEPTRITEDIENVLDLFFSNNPSLVNRVEVIPGSQSPPAKTLTLLERFTSIIRQTLHLSKMNSDM